MTHIRIIDSLSGRRINDTAGKAHTLCGAEMTDQDLTWRDALVDVRGSHGFLTCPKCLEATKKSV